MDAAAADELRRLRARAYGPDADIADDAEALARLYELEALSSEARTSGDPGGDVSSRRAARVSLDDRRERLSEAEGDRDEVSSESVDDREGQEPRDSDPSETRDDSAANRRRWIRSRPAAILLAAVAVLAIVAVTATVTSRQTRSGVYDAPVEAVLAAIPGAEAPTFFGPPNTDSSVFADFYGLTPISASMPTGGPGRSDCLVVLESAALAAATENSYPGISFYGCGAGPFAPSISLLVGSEMPEALRERYRVGTALQFVLEDDGVVVLSGAATDDA